jgi:hypothetical protein
MFKVGRRVPIDQRRYETSDRTDSHWTDAGFCSFFFVLPLSASVISFCPGRRIGVSNELEDLSPFVVPPSPERTRQLPGVHQMLSTIIQFPPIFLLLLDFISLFFWPGR